jgi:plasmid replication initiation protein
LLCIAKIDSRQNIPANYEFIVSVDDMALEIGTAKENAYRDLKKAVNSLYSRTILLDPNEPDTEMRWLFKKAFFKSTGVAVLSMSPSIFPFLFELKERFTTYKLKDVAKFKCSYSIRFYELLIQFKKRDTLSVDVDCLRTALQLGDKYPRTSDIKKYVVIPSIKDINSFSNLSVEFSQIKRGKEITQFVFEYAPKEVKHTATQKTQGTKPLIPLFTGHPTYTVDSQAILADHQRLKTKPEPKPKKILDSDKKSKITGLKRAVTHG